MNIKALCLKMDCRAKRFSALRKGAPAPDFVKLGVNNARGHNDCVLYGTEYLC
jgi:hypothetical protein